MSKLKVSDYMTRDVITLSSESSVDEGISLIRSTGHDGFPIVDYNRRVIGYVSARDLLKQDPETIIKNVMIRELYVARDYMDLRDTARVMFRTGHSKLPVVDDREHLVGIISNSDVIRSQIERADPDKVEKLKRTIEKVHNVTASIEHGFVDVNRLIPTQTKIYADELKGRVYELRRGLAEPIVTIKKDKWYFVIDGHHRVVAARRIGAKKLDAYIIIVPDDIELGIERLAKKKRLKSLRDVQVIENVPHPLVEITFKNVK